VRLLAQLPDRWPCRHLTSALCSPALETGGKGPVLKPVLLVSYAAPWALVMFQGLLRVGLVRASGLSPPAQRSAAADGPKAALLSAPPPTPGALTGEPASPSTTTDVIGASVDSATLAGQLRLLVFVALSCPKLRGDEADLTASATVEQATGRAGMRSAGTAVPPVSRTARARSNASGRQRRADHKLRYRRDSNRRPNPGRRCRRSVPPPRTTRHKMLQQFRARISFMPRQEAVSQ